MNFKLYDILSSLIPGFLVLLAVLSFLDKNFDNDLALAYTAIAFLIGFLITTLGSWLEDFFYLTWGGKPSDALLDGRSIWKVKFYHSKKVKKLLLTETESENPCNNELFLIATLYINYNGNRIEDFSASYAFARSLLTSALIGGLFLMLRYYTDWKIYILIISIVIVLWLRCKQRAYYYAREVLNNYLKIKIQ